MTDEMTIKKKLAEHKQAIKKLKKQLKTIGEETPLKAKVTRSDVECRMLRKYVSKRKSLTLAEVPAGNLEDDSPWGPSDPRKIDGVMLIGEPPAGLYSHNGNIALLRSYFKGKDIEIIEVKRHLNRPVIGQLVAGYHLFHKQYKVKPKKMTALVMYADSALEWAATKKLGIHVEVVSPPKVK